MKIWTWTIGSFMCIGFLYLVVTTAYAQYIMQSYMKCSPEEVVQNNLREKFKEVVIGRGFLNEKVMFQLHVSAERKFTVTRVDIGTGIACVVLGGEEWEFIKPTPIEEDPL